MVREFHLQRRFRPDLLPELSLDSPLMHASTLCCSVIRACLRRSVRCCSGPLLYASKLGDLPGLERCGGLKSARLAFPKVADGNGDRLVYDPDAKFRGGVTARSGVTDRGEIRICFLAEDSVGAAQLPGDTALFEIDDFCGIEDRFICECLACLPILSAASTSASDTGLGLTIELACFLVTGSAIDDVREHNGTRSGEGESKCGIELLSTA